MQTREMWNMEIFISPVCASFDISAGIPVNTDISDQNPETTGQGARILSSAMRQNHRPDLPSASDPVGLLSCSKSSEHDVPKHLEKVLQTGDRGVLVVDIV
jgi:hypothetical protein